MKPQHWIATDTGAVRDHNEDAFLWMGPSDTGDNGYLWLIADGMGGESAGEVASRTVVQAVSEIYPVAMKRGVGPLDAIRQCLEAANQRIRRIQKEKPHLQKMGTTAVVAAVYEGRIYIGHVGDSRAYIYKRGELRQITRDHTQLEAMLDAGALTPEEARSHPSGNVLTRAIGRKQMEVSLSQREGIPARDCVLLLCSDGVSGFVPDEYLKAATERLYARDATLSLLDLSREFWSDDNATAAVVRFLEPKTEILTTRESFMRWAKQELTTSNASPPTTQLRASIRPGEEDAPPDANVERTRNGGAAAQSGTAVPGRTERMTPASDSKTAAPARSIARTVSSSTRKSNTASNKRTGNTEKNPLAAAQSATASARDSTHTTGPMIPGSRPVTESSSRKRRNTPNPAGLKADDLKRINEWESTEHLSDAELLGEMDPGRKKLLVAIFLLVALIAALVLALFLRSPGSESDTGQDDPVAAQEDETDPPPPDDNDPGHDDPRDNLAAWQAEIRQLWREMPRDIPAMEPDTPDRVVAPDRMPVFGIPVDDTIIYIDAHEVTVGQYQLVMQTDDTLRILHRETDAPRYRYAACSPGISTDVADPLEPVCVSPESARRYCAAVGRRLPSRSDWRRVFPRAERLIARGNGLLMSTTRDGVAPPVLAPDKVDSIQGVFDGYPEVLDSNDLDSARGDVPVLGSVGHAERAFSSNEDLAVVGIPLSVLGGLAGQLDSNDVPSEDRVQLGFRCVADAQRYEEIREFDPEVDRSPAITSTETQRLLPSGVNPRRGGDSRILRISPRPYRGPRIVPTAPASEPRMEGMLDRIEDELESNR